MEILPKVFKTGSGPKLWMAFNMTLAPLSKRVYALLIDSMLIVFVLFACPPLGISGIVYAVIAALMLFVYDPFCVAVWGQTVGHRLMRIKVINANGLRPSVPQAVGRWLIKGFLGLWSFLTMMFNGNAVHDLATKTKVVLVGEGG